MTRAVLYARVSTSASNRRPGGDPRQDPEVQLGPLREYAARRELIVQPRTARIQTVDRTTNPRFYGVIENFAGLTGIPVVLNTSFNLHEPIVESPENAISCYLRTQMDVLVLGDFYVTDRKPA